MWVEGEVVMWLVGSCEGKGKGRRKKHAFQWAKGGINIFKDIRQGACVAWVLLIIM